MGNGFHLLLYITYLAIKRARGREESQREGGREEGRAAAAAGLFG